MSASIRYEQRGRIALLTLDRPERHNALTFPMMRELAAAWDEIKRDDGIACAIVTGAGEKAFCTGMDLSGISAADAEVLGATDSALRESPVFKLTALQNRCWKPVITAVNGMVCGGGFHFLADSDLILSVDTATFFDNHVAVGLVAGLEPVGLARRIPLEQVFRLALLGGSERMDAPAALACGLVGEVLPRERLLERAFELAEKIGRHSLTALMRTKRAIWESLDGGLQPGLEATWRIIAEHQAHPDSREGAKAFAEGRAPAWGAVPDSLK